MTRPFAFDASQNLYAYSVESLLVLCTEDPLTAYRHITSKNIERWLFRMGEIELYKTAKQIRIQPNPVPVQTFINTFNQHLNNRKFFDLLNIDKAIEITLKEYETLKSEILQNVQNRSQLILLGLAAIFTLIGLGLAPLSDFLTEEEITTNPIQPNSSINLQINSQDPHLENYSFSVKPNKQTLKIRRRTNPETIERKAIVPSVIIFSWLVPVGCQYIIYRVLNWTKSNIKIGSYIAYRIEKRIYDLMLLKYTGNLTPLNKSNITHLFWENYMRADESSKDLEASVFIIIIFNIIIWCSLIGSWILLNFNYDQTKVITKIIVDENQSIFGLFWYLAFIIVYNLIIVAIIISLIHLFDFGKTASYFFKLIIGVLCNLLLFCILTNGLNGWQFFVQYNPSEFKLLDNFLIVIPIFLNNFFLINRIFQFSDCLNIQNEVKKDILDNRNKTLGKMWDL